MVHVTAAIGVGLAFLLKAMFWSVAPAVAAVLFGAGVFGLILWRVSRRR